MLIFIGIDLFKIYISYEKYKNILKNIDFNSDIILYHFMDIHKFSRRYKYFYNKKVFLKGEQFISELNYQQYSGDILSIILIT